MIIIGQNKRDFLLVVIDGIFYGVNVFTDLFGNYIMTEYWPYENQNLFNEIYFDQVLNHAI